MKNSPIAPFHLDDACLERLRVRALQAYENIAKSPKSSRSGNERRMIYIYDKAYNINYDCRHYERGESFLTRIARESAEARLPRPKFGPCF